MNKLNELMAVEVMGWYKDRRWWCMGERKSDGRVPDVVMEIKDWNPTTDDTQARMCAEKWVHDNDNKDDRSLLFIEYSNYSYQIALRRKGNITISLQGEKLPLTICEAIKEAMKE